MKRITVVAAVVLCLVIFVGTPVATLAQQQTPPPEEAILGFDPIELIAGREVLGDTDLAVDHDGLRYLFVSVANRDKFLRDPERYGVQLGGLCVRLGGTTRGDQDLYRVFEGRIYLFASNHCVEVFETAPHRFIEPEPLPSLLTTSSAEARARGAELIEAAVDAFGGADAIDAVDNMVEGLVVRRPDDGALTEMERTVTVDFAHSRMRGERVYPSGSLVQVWTHEGAWAQGFGSVSDYSRAQAANLHEELVISNPLYILRLRHRDGFVAASLGTGSAGVLEHVAIEWADNRWTLGIEPETGMLASVGYTDRGIEGNWGEVIHFLTDYRPVGAINWPHRRVVTFDGENVPWWNTETRALRVNVELDDELFTPPGVRGSR